MGRGILLPGGWHHPPATGLRSGRYNYSREGEKKERKQHRTKTEHSKLMLWIIVPSSPSPPQYKACSLPPHASPYCTFDKDVCRLSCRHVSYKHLYILLSSCRRCRSFLLCNPGHCVARWPHLLVATIYIYCTYFHRWVGVLVRPLNLLFTCPFMFWGLVVFFIRIPAHFEHSFPIPPTASKLSKTWKTNFVHFFFLHLMAVLKTYSRIQKMSNTSTKCSTLNMAAGLSTHKFLAFTTFL